MSLQQVSKNNYISKYFRFTAAAGVTVEKSRAGYALMLGGIPTAVYIGGKQDGEAVTEEVKPGQSVKLTYGTINPHRYQVITSIHGLHRLGVVNSVTIYDEEDGVQPLEVILHAKVSFDVAALPSGAVRLYGID